MTKPFGGLWASREEASYGWKYWCENENFFKYPGYFRHYFKFELIDATVYTIKSMIDLKNLPLLKEGKYLCNSVIDFEKCLKDGIDAIELCCYGDEFYKENRFELFYALYGWDCDSIIVMNPDKIKEKENDQND